MCMRMEMRATSLFSTASAILLLMQLYSPVSATRTFNEEFEYKGRHTGPDHWGEMHKEWAACNAGHLQSPIELNNTEMVDMSGVADLKRHYFAARATVTNRGQDIMVHWEEPSGGFTVNGTRFYLQQLHWHKPSEHHVNGERFDVEMHMVHMSLENKFAVLTGLYRRGAPDPFLEEMKPYINAVKAKRNKKVDAGKVNANHTALDGAEYYRYMGSLTTPPCTEGVIWTVMKHIKTVSRDQIHRLTVATPRFHKNARPLQKTENRTVKYYHEL